MSTTRLVHVLCSVAMRTDCCRSFVNCFLIKSACALSILRIHPFSWRSPSWKHKAAARGFAVEDRIIRHGLLATPSTTVPGARRLGSGSPSICGARVPAQRAAGLVAPLSTLAASGLMSDSSSDESQKRLGIMPCLMQADGDPGRVDYQRSWGSSPRPFGMLVHIMHFTHFVSSHHHVGCILYHVHCMLSLYTGPYTVDAIHIRPYMDAVHSAQGIVRHTSDTLHSTAPHAPNLAKHALESFIVHPT